MTEAQGNISAQETLEWTDDEIIPISAISHHLYCKRQNALIHVEGVFQDNDLTVSGNIGHTVVDQQASLVEKGLHRETSMHVYSDRYGLRGIADVVEFPENAAPIPVDYKHGRKKLWQNLDAQLCAIALCLEEMCRSEINEGAIYHMLSRRRRRVVFTTELRKVTLQAVAEIREMLVLKILPPAIFDRRCLRCSLRPACMPEANPSLNNPFELI
ncbi:MAG: CRISPR-associated protein Cas4 [Leptospiraceae bacterium]|nr:CRISPR-associated protein Cas4 [Leptospiraceae bacterium]